MSVNPVCWFEIYVDDLDRAAAFYETVFATKLEKRASPVANFQMVAFPMAMGAHGAAGTLCKLEGVRGGGGGTIVYFRSEDCGIEAGRIEEAGGKVHMPKTSVGDYGWIVLGVDTEGNMFGIHSLK